MITFKKKPFRLKYDYILPISGRLGIGHVFRTGGDSCLLKMCNGRNRHV